MPRLAIAQIRPHKGEYAANLQRIGGVLAQVAALDPPVDLVVFPETATSGYFVEGGVREVAVTAGTLFRDLEGQYGGTRPLDVAVGFYELFQNRYYNSCLYATLGPRRSGNASPGSASPGNASSGNASPANASPGNASPGIKHVHRKVFLPTYGVFDEGRFVERGLEIRAFDTAWGRAAILICEDAWHSLSATIAALDGAQLIILPSASPARGAGPQVATAEVSGEPGPRLPTSSLRWERILRGLAEEHGVYVAYASLVGFEGGKGFPGGSVVVSPWGEIVTRGALFEEAIVTADVNLDQITRARADSPLLADLEMVLPHLIKSLGKGEAGSGKGKAPAIEFDAAPDGTAASRVSPPASRLHTVGGKGGGEGDPLALDVELAYRWLVAFLKDEVVERRGFKKGIVGLSGGVDSSLTAFLAAAAFGRENVVGVRMPYRTSSPESLEHAQLVIDKLGIPSVTVDISDAVDGYLRQAGDVTPTRQGNVMARERMIVLFDQSAKANALPLGTGNKSERLLGYFTWHADDTPPVNPLGDLFKIQVWALARHVGVPEVIVNKPATADLIQGQTDEGDFGISYPKADHILYHLLRGLRPEEIVALGFTLAEIALVRGRLESSHWKRRLPTVAMMSQTAIGEFYLRPVDY
jgi:NAD+ synthase (glutamine-hydrolysing)